MLMLESSYVAANFCLQVSLFNMKIAQGEVIIKALSITDIFR